MTDTRNPTANDSHASVKATKEKCPTVISVGREQAVASPTGNVRTCEPSEADFGLGDPVSKATVG